MRAVTLALLSLVVVATVVLAYQMLPKKGSSFYAKSIAELLDNAEDGVYTIYVPYPVYFTDDGHVVVAEPSGHSVAEVKNVRLLPSRGQGTLKIFVKDGKAWIGSENKQSSETSEGGSEDEEFPEKCLVEVRRGCPSGQGCLVVGLNFYVYSSCKSDSFEATVFPSQQTVEGAMERCQAGFCGKINVQAELVRDIIATVYLDGRPVGTGRLAKP